MSRRYKCAHIFDIECGFGGYAVCGEEVVDGCPEELAVDEEFERYRLFGFEKTVYECRELVTAKF